VHALQKKNGGVQSLNKAATTKEKPVHARSSLVLPSFPFADTDKVL